MNHGARGQTARLDGPRAWSVALAGALASGIAFGTTYTFGAFFDAMVVEFDAGRGATALVFGVTLLLFFGTGIVSGPLCDRLGPTPLVASGAVLVAAGLYLTSKVDTVALGYLTYGVGAGFGGGLVITPVIAVAGAWFTRRRALAMGVVATGNGLGTLILVPLAERLIDRDGWRDAYVTLALIDLVLLLLAAIVVVRPPVPPAPPPIARMKAVARTGEFKTLYLTVVLFSVALFVAFAFIVDFATDDGLSSSRAALVVGLVGASSVVGRLGITALSSRVPSVRLLQGCLSAQPVAFAIWMVADDNFGLLVLFAVLLGVAYGGFVGLAPEVTAALFGVIGLGGIMGLSFTATGVGGLIGPPLAGWLSDATDGQTIPIVLTLVASSAAVAVCLRLPADGRQVDLEAPAGDPASRPART